ncbi:MAG TPA: LCP family protein [Actinomycetes bacterium]|jgi:LCP family protein required for cell wall assembly|nr:LCP family protein [Actinomycetes bacterium]
MARATDGTTVQQKLELPPVGGSQGRRRWWSDRPRGARPLVAAVLSCLLPGAGQLYLGRTRRGAAMVAVTVACVLAGVALWQDRSGLARMLVRPEWLLGLLAVDAALLGFRASSVADAYRLGAAHLERGPVRHRGMARLVVVLVLGLTAAPHAVAAYYDLEAYDLLASVFGRRDPSWTAADRPVRGATPAVPGDRLTVLLLGGDAGWGRTGLRTDTMIVASMEPATGRAVLFGLPRNLIQVPLPDGPARAFACRCFPHPLNELYGYAEEHPDLFPGSRRPGVTAVMGAAERLLGIRIDHYALVDLKGFVEVVDALGGVTVTVSEPVRVEIDRLGEGDGGPRFHIKPGRHHLDGLTALAFARARKETTDYDRMRRQRCLLGSLARQTDARRLLRAFPRLVPVVKRNVSTDIPLDRLPDLVELAGRQRVNLATVGFGPPGFVAGWASGGYPVPDVTRIRATVRAMLAGRAATTVAETDHGGTVGTSRPSRPAAGGSATAAGGSGPVAQGSGAGAGGSGTATQGSHAAAEGWVVTARGSHAAAQAPDACTSVRRLEP